MFSPVDLIVREAPAEFPVGSGKVIVTRFFDLEFMVNKVGTEGDVVRAQPYV